MPKLKYCGITRVEDALAAIDCGAAYIGLIFVPESNRRIQVGAARTVARAVKGKAGLVGVFRNASLSEVVSVAGFCGLDLIQYHGQESRAQCEQTPLPIIKSIELGANCEQQMDSYRDCVQHFLFDLPKDADSTISIDATLKQVSALAKKGDYFFAGSLKSDLLPTVSQVISPFCLDVARGIELSPGVKCPSLMRDFAAAAALSWRSSEVSNRRFSLQSI